MAKYEHVDSQKNKPGNWDYVLTGVSGLTCWV
jgi:hypothetical protein